MIAANIMTMGTALPESATLADAASILSVAGAVAVVDGDGKVLGLVTGRLLERASRDAAPVREAMEKGFAAINPEADFKAVSLALDSDSAGGVPAVVVVDDGSRFLGLITPEDMQRRVWEYTEKKKAGKG